MDCGVIDVDVCHGCSEGRREGRKEGWKEEEGRGVKRRNDMGGKKEESKCDNEHDKRKGKEAKGNKDEK